MLGLKLPTDPRWVNLAEISLEAILTDHAYCEQKAATNCITLIQLNPEKERLVEEMAPIVTEEWGHFRQVLRLMKQRGFKLGRQRKDEYVNLLHENMKKGGSREDHFLERILVAALIEARSCERFRLLSEGLEDPELKSFYREFMISEAGHYRLFTDLAREYVDPEKVKNRWEEWLEIEVGIMNKLEVRGERIH